MVTVTFIHADESEQKVTGVAGSTVMQLAIDEGVEGSVAECGGGCACATWRVHPTISKPKCLTALLPSAKKIVACLVKLP
jgi:ferredoxin